MALGLVEREEHAGALMFTGEINLTTERGSCRLDTLPQPPCDPLFAFPMPQRQRVAQRR